MTDVGKPHKEAGIMVHPLSPEEVWNPVKEESMPCLLRDTDKDTNTKVLLSTETSRMKPMNDKTKLLKAYPTVTNSKTETGKVAST